ncbi:MAG: hypothetical protein J6Q15_00980, partial [Clostridia bacterium]|nr:hypothetical protein [Clostridia bacterium]
YIFNSEKSGAYEFKLATYPTYAIQEELESDDTLSFIGRLNSGRMITKVVAITVNGSEAQQISFDGDASNIAMQLFQTNKWVINDYSMVDAYNLGLTLSKTNSGTQILGRYNELKFLENESFIGNIIWNFKSAKVDVDGETIKRDDYGNIEYHDSNVIFRFSTIAGNKKATLTGVNIPGIVGNVEYDVVVSSSTIELRYEKDEVITYISIPVEIDDVTGKVYLPKVDGQHRLVAVQMTQMENGGQVWSQNLYLNQQVINCFIFDGNYYKTLQSGIYLAILGQIGSEKLLLNDRFVTNIEYNDASSIITTNPIDGNLSAEAQLYAIVVNSNGTWTYTTNPRKININESDTEILVNDNESLLEFPVVLGDEINYGLGFDVRDLVHIKKAGSYNEILMFAPKYSVLDKKPDSWGNGLKIYSYDGLNYSLCDSSSLEFVSGIYYVKNNFKTIDTISIVNNDKEYFLLGYMENNYFVNKVVADGINYYSKLYPVIVKTKYLPNDKRVQTAEEYINELLSAKYNTEYNPDGNNEYTYCTINGNGGAIKYDLSLLQGRYIYKQPNAYIKTTGDYNINKAYYFVSNGMFVQATSIPVEDILDWANQKSKYYEAVNMVDVEQVDDGTSELKKYHDDDVNGVYEEADPTLQYLTSLNVAVSHYIIKSVNNDGNNITITASAVSGGVELSKLQTFVISVADYNKDKNGADGHDNVFKVNYYNIYTNSDVTITAISYYDFERSNIKPIAGFAGNYFDAEQSKVGSDYQIIAGHKNIELGWDETTSDPIGGKVAITSLNLDYVDNAQILTDMATKLSVLAVQYNANNQEVGYISDDKITITYNGVQYLPASNVYNDKISYFNKITMPGGDTYELADISQEIIDDWANKYEGYYIASIQAEFVVHNTINIIEGHYIRFEWTYSDGERPYKIYSPKLNVLSRDVTGYNINVNETLYVAQKLTASEYDGKFYEYLDVNNKFVLVDTAVTSYVPNIYYSLTEYSGALAYELRVGYDTTRNAYTYYIYLTNTSGNYLCVEASESEYSIRNIAADIALSLSTEGGWVKPAPFYADNARFGLEDNGYIEFNSLDNSIKSIKLTDNDYKTVIGRAN